MRIPKAVPSLPKPTDNKRAAITEAAEGRRPRFKQLATANSDNLMLAQPFGTGRQLSK
jgi:hypothetical protein